MPADIAKLRELAGRLERRSGMVNGTRVPTTYTIDYYCIADAIQDRDASIAVLSLLDELDRVRAALGEAETALRGVWTWSEEDAKGIDRFVEEDVLAALKSISAALSDEMGIKAEE